MRNRKVSAGVLTIAAAMMLCGCREVNDTLYSHYADSGREGFRQGHPLVFEPRVADTTRYGSDVRMELLLRYKPDRPMGSLPFLLSAEDADGEICNDTVVVSLYKGDGTPRDPQHYGICSHNVTVISNVRMPRDMTVSLVPLAPDSAAAGLRSIGFKISAIGPYSTAP